MCTVNAKYTTIYTSHIFICFIVKGGEEIQESIDVGARRNSMLPSGSGLLHVSNYIFINNNIVYLCFCMFAQMFKVITLFF